MHDPLALPVSRSMQRDLLPFIAIFNLEDHVQDRVVLDIGVGERLLVLHDRSVEEQALVVYRHARDSLQTLLKIYKGLGRLGVDKESLVVTLDADVDRLRSAVSQ
eukprot:c929_g1_i2.p1 GENE.c929_g1_i2~~c929_g1_i2.p1  ORF type:complete len:105 (+),score=8.51 c929_g1_i2:242-556(+)